jgi:hypothetical protein
MKKPLMMLAALLFLGAVSAPVFAADPAPVKTPAAKVMKHKVHHKKKSAKKAVKPTTTPVAK